MKWVKKTKKLNQALSLMQLFIFPLVVGLGLSACQKQNPHSILVIALDDFTVNDLNCNEDTISSPSGISTLCKEAVRFTHAYTPSILSNAALASLLTGLYPFEHKVRSNSAPPLAPEFLTVAEQALIQGYRTSFFSGGAPIFSRTGLNQGFEEFKDTNKLTPTQLYRPISQSISKAIEWIEGDINHPFFSVIYAPDLSFMDAQTYSAAGEAQSKNYENRLQVVDHELHTLFQFLKKKKLWNNTLIIFTGLNGHTESARLNTIQPLNLHSENTQIGLIIKPWQMKRDEQLSWKIDKNVSLVDVGVTIKSFLIDNKGPETKNQLPFQKIDLKNALMHGKSTIGETKPIVIESGWGEWHNLATIKFAFIWENYLYLADEENQIFNTYTDKLEANPIDISETNLKFQSLILEGKRYLSLKNWKLKDPKNIRMHQIPYSMWTNRNDELSLKKEILKLKPIAKDRFVEQLIEKLKISDLNENQIKNMNKITNCINLLQNDFEASNIKNCNDLLFLKFLKFVKGKQNDDLEWLSFLKAYSYYQMDYQIILTNLGMHSIWDTYGIERNILSAVDYALQLPQYKNLKEKINKELFFSTEDEL